MKIINRINSSKFRCKQGEDGQHLLLKKRKFNFIEFLLKSFKGGKL